MNQLFKRPVEIGLTKFVSSLENKAKSLGTRSQIRVEAVTKMHRNCSDNVTFQEFFSLS